MSSFLKIAPILISEGKLESFKLLLINSEVSIISASIISYSPFNNVYTVCIVPLWTCFKIVDTVVILGSTISSIFNDDCSNP